MNSILLPDLERKNDSTDVTWIYSTMSQEEYTTSHREYEKYEISCLDIYALNA